LSNDDIFCGDEKPVVEKLKSLGIEGTRHFDRVDIYDDEYLNLDKWNADTMHLDEDVWLKGDDSFFLVI